MQLTRQSQQIQRQNRRRTSLLKRCRKNRYRQQREEVVRQDAESPAKAPSRAAGDLTILAFTSDIHNQEDGIAKERLDSWMDYVEGVYGQPIDSMNFCGDMGAASANESQFWTYTRAVMDVVDGQGVHGFYTTGNHEYYNGKFKSTTNAVKGEFVIGAEDPYTTGANYHMYALGTTVDWNGSGSRSDQYEQEQIDALTAYLDQQEGPEPIIILAHFPLHRYNTRTTAKAEDVIDVLNAAAQAGKKIVFLWGHNHTLSDTNYDQIFKPGDTIEYANGSSKQIDFYYASAGCMSDSEYGSGGWGGGGTSGSAYVKGKGLVITIDDQNRLSFAYYNATGTDVTEGGPFTEGDAVAAESIALSPKEMSVAVGDSASITVSYTPATTTQRTVNWTSSDTSVATVDSAGKVTGVRVGTATITATYAGDDTISDTCEVTVKRAPGSGVTPENGKKYVILAGDEYALTSEGDEVGYSNGSGDQIFHYYGLTGEEFTIGETVTPDHLLWTFETSEDGTGFYIKANTGEYLNGTYAENDEGGSTGTLKLDETKDVWIITGMTAEGAPAGAHILKSTNASATASSDKYLTHGNGDNGGDHTNIFTLRSEDNATAVIFYEYNDDGTAVEDPDDPPVDPPTPTDGTVYKLVDQFTSGSDYLIVSRNDAGSGYALTNPGGTSSGASMASTAVTVQSGDIDGDGTADMYISTDAADVVWTATANDERFNVTNGGDYLEGKSGDVHIFNSQQYSDRGWTYTDHQLKHEGGTNTYVVYYDGSAFKATRNSSSDEIYIYEKTETVQGEDPVESVELNKESLTLTEGDSATLTATVKPATAADKSVTWTSSDEDVATVDEHGKVTAVAEGTAAITVTTTDGGKTAVCEVTVEAAPPAAKYVLTDTLEAGKEYLIVNDATVGGSGSQALKNPGGTSGGASPGKTAVTVLDGNIIETADTDIVWTATENEGGFYLTNNGDYLEVYQGNLRIYNPVKQGARYWTYADTHLTHRGGSNPYYAAYSNGSFAYSSSAAEIYLFVRQEETVHEHTWGEWTVTTPATCSATGVETRVCEECGETETRETAIDENAHAWGEWTVTVPATETEDGVATRVCANDPAHTETQVIPASGHAHSMTKVEAQSATCTEDGNIEYWTCTTCGKLFSDEDGTTEITQAETIVPKTDHNWGEWTTLLEPTCTEKGVRYRTCSFNALHMELEDIDPTGHAPVKTEAKAATCTEDGNIDYWTCSRCGKTYSDEACTTEVSEVALTAHGHDWSAWVVTKAATCSAPGSEERVCANDPSHKESRETAIDGNAHRWGEWEVLVPATCTGKGLRIHRCVYSNSHAETEVIPPAAHQWGEWIVVTAPTCTTAGCKTRSCEVCGRVETGIIPADAEAHDWGDWIVLKAAGCGEAGVEIRTCVHNGMHNEFRLIPALSHKMIKVEANAATSMTVGNIEYYKCDICGDMFFDAEGTQPATRDDVLLKRGWLLEDGEWYYYDGSGDTDKGTKRCNAWASDSVGWCWLDSEGKMTRDKWIKDNGEWYYLKSNGYMAANEWAKDSKGWCYMTGSGKMAKDRWIQNKGQWYYLKANGYMAANEWAKDSKGWCYMDGSGKMTKSKWIQYKDSWYYLNSSGYMVTGTQTIGGKTYRFDSSGKWIQ